MRGAVGVVRGVLLALDSFFQASDAGQGGGLSADTNHHAIDVQTSKTCACAHRRLLARGHGAVPISHWPLSKLRHARTITFAEVRTTMNRCACDGCVWMRDNQRYCDRD